jgi:hypothetical protein
VAQVLPLPHLDLTLVFEPLLLALDYLIGTDARIGSQSITLANWKDVRRSRILQAANTSAPRTKSDSQGQPHSSLTMGRGKYGLLIDDTGRLVSRLRLVTSSELLLS